MSTSRDELLEQTSTQRDAAWAAFGDVDDDVITHLINPALMGGPRWPAMRQAYRVARGPRGLLIASDGLADPFDEDHGPQDKSGCELELYAHTADPIEKASGSWLFDMVWQMSNFAANHGGIRALLDELGTLSTELYDVKIPEAAHEQWVNDAGRVGVLLGLDDDAVPATVNGPLSEIRLVNIKLLTVAEVQLAADEGDAGRAKLVELLRAQGNATRSTLSRACVVE